MHFEWDSALETGFSAIDEQHQALFDLANRLQVVVETEYNDPNAVKDAVYGLVDYVVEHFHDEEALMAAYSYPALGPHRALHEELSGKTLTFIAREVNEENIEPSELAPLICAWLTGHIPTHDKAFVQHMERLHVSRGIEH